MLRIEVISANGDIPRPPVEMQFEESGGTIGRAPHNTLPLPDPDRRVSRVHAQFVRRQGIVKIISRSSNELLVDGQSLEIGEEIPLRDGAHIAMGGYVLRASLLGAGPAEPM